MENGKQKPIQKANDILAKTIDSEIIAEMKSKNPELFKPKYETKQNKYHK